MRRRSRSAGVMVNTSPSQGEILGSNPGQSTDSRYMGRLLQVPKGLTPLAELALLEGRKPTGHEWKTWVLNTHAVWRENNGETIRVPDGFMTDFASIPFLFRWWQTGSVGPQRVAAYFHDWLYSSQTGRFSRKDSDRIFREVMKAAGGSGSKRYAMWAALRVGGFMAWRSNQRKYKKLGPLWRQLQDGT
jgi:hypothetical protein